MAREAGKISTTPSEDTGSRTGIPAAAGSCKACYIILVQERANPALRAFSTAGATARLTKFTVAG